MQASFAQRREKAVRDIDWPAAPSKAAKDAWTAVQNAGRRPGPRASACSAVLRKHMYHMFMVRSCPGLLSTVRYAAEAWYPAARGRCLSPYPQSVVKPVLPGRSLSFCEFSITYISYISSFSGELPCGQGLRTSPRSTCRVLTQHHHQQQLMYFGMASLGACCDGGSSFLTEVQNRVIPQCLAAQDRHG